MTTYTTGATGVGCVSITVSQLYYLQHAGTYTAFNATILTRQPDNSLKKSTYEYLGYPWLLVYTQWPIYEVKSNAIQHSSVTNTLLCLFLVIYSNVTIP